MVFSFPPTFLLFESRCKFSIRFHFFMNPRQPTTPVVLSTWNPSWTLGRHKWDILSSPSHVKETRWRQRKNTSLSIKITTNRKWKSKFLRMRRTIYALFYTRRPKFKFNLVFSNNFFCLTKKLKIFTLCGAFLTALLNFFLSINKALHW